MPCEDMSESIIVELDSHGRLHDYRLFKGTCGAPVGQESRLSEHLRGLEPEKILAIDQPPGSESPFGSKERFLDEKHLRALKVVLADFTGAKVEIDRSRCILDRISQDENQLTISAHLQVEASAHNVRACNRSCGSQKSPE